MGLKWFDLLLFFVQYNKVSLKFANIKQKPIAAWVV